MHWIFYVLVGIVALIVMIGLIAGMSLAYPKRLTSQGAYDLENKRSPGLMDIYDRWTLDPYRIKSRHHYELQLYHLPADCVSNRYVIIAHGYGYTHHGSVKYALMMHELGFHVVLFDERYHGNSGGKNCTMGFYEKEDLREIVTDTLTRFGQDILLGTYGESMGGAAVLLEQATDPRVRFCVTDCTFADLGDLMADILKRKTHLPRYPFLGVANVWFYLFTGVWFTKIKPIDAVKKASIPMMFVHGEADGFIPPIHSQRLFDACGSPKKIYIGKNQARHTESVRKNPEEYRKILRAFLVENHLMET
jgi:hypothetical protein